MELICRAREPKFTAEGAALFGEQIARRVLVFHKGFPEYQETPLRGLEHLAAELGVKGIYIKDESGRFGLESFKALGSSYAMGCHVAELLGKRPEEVSWELLAQEHTRSLLRLKKVLFATATDGNHGRGVAWMANRLGCGSAVYMPRGSSEVRMEKIRALGAVGDITAKTYDETVEMVREMAAREGWTVVQDTDEEGYTEIPTRIMQGYTTMALEAYRQLEALGKRPTHIFLQAGVGSMAAAVAAFFAGAYPENEQPRIILVEPDSAACLCASAAAEDGNAHPAEGELETMMAGLNCGVPCGLAWKVLRGCGDGFVRMSDRYAARAMRILASPLPGDPQVISGESGCAGFAAAYALLRDYDKDELRRALGMNPDSVVLCFSTEGATDAEHYRRVVWGGELPWNDDQPV